jgi:hypothetical protein
MLKLTIFEKKKYGEDRIKCFGVEQHPKMNQCLKRRISCVEMLKREVKAWQEHRNNKNSTIN